MVEVSEHDLNTLLEWGLMAEKDGVITRSIWLRVYRSIPENKRNVHRELPYWVSPEMARLDTLEGK